MESFPDIENITIPANVLEEPLFRRKKVSVTMLRLDAVHPVISGNKLFKLFYFLQQSIQNNNAPMITFGGTYSNHLAATSYAGNILGIRTIGLVRGERPVVLSPTLQFCIENQMELQFINRREYSKLTKPFFSHKIEEEFSAGVLIPEGGFSVVGLRGASLISNYFKGSEFTHTCCPIGSATTFAGLIAGNNHSKILGFPVLKNLNDIEIRLHKLGINDFRNSAIIPDYHFGGYAKKNNELIRFINDFYISQKIPLDFVYTGKMMFGVYDLVKKNYFPEGAKIMCIHTGGLQGNQSLAHGILKF
jgi:1-aminocyclopropane-1-carboxylate deaminase/D-cysteine desulfhydrase-like pyridoxal-dependent ACC family enzyme